VKQRRKEEKKKNKTVEVLAERKGDVREIERRLLAT
jgi:hypothetical protein